ncbi:hypothetical protein H2201_000197 [Coniosporium apollinis]|uniref:CENP-V/GFA domain-containing protein n=2 Tax=Coniosporium TaxID=2810619 RepID=A0ABQ9P5E5_9PEZI|nr:hypothetical protein H2199_008160 [Cladosporium sp. JES 115]KAJ9669811.1 hypothetical protein H2201_000197 [Coniosporium apollinis]
MSSDAPSVQGTASQETSTQDTSTQETHQGGCHCARIRFTATLPDALTSTQLTDCNCSICIKNGYHFVYLPNSSITFHRGQDEARKYFFHKQRIAHYFCGECGTSVWAESIDPEFYAGWKALNVRVFDDVDMSTLKFEKLDGKSF